MNIPSKQKRVAICFSGQPRALYEGYHFHKTNLIRPNENSYQIDIFFHSWSCEQVKSFEDLYNPVSLLTEPSTRKNVPLEFKQRYGYHSLVSEAYSCLQSDLLRRAEETYRGFRYDWVIKSRTDFAINVPIFLDSLDPTKIYFTDIGYTGSIIHPCLAIGNSKNMEHVCAYFSSIDPEAFQSTTSNRATEEVLFRYLSVTGLIDKVILFHHPNPFPPGNWNSTPHSLIRDDMDIWLGS